MFDASSTIPTAKESCDKRESLTRALSDGCLPPHGHEPRARVTTLWLLLTLQLTLMPLAAPWPAWSHDQSVPQTTKNAERRQVRIRIEDFLLTDQASQPFRFGSQRGKVVIVAFAYTTCPDVCPLVTAAMRQLQEGLSERERRSTFLITITTDPEIDTPPVMAAYAERYGVDRRNWAFLTADETALGKVWANFGVKINKKARGLIDHTTLTAVIDGDGVMRVAYIGPVLDVKALRQDLRKLLQPE